ncbi:hypothetical protein P9112_007032 [Eukaryota sp. TZLM1-RC]
MFLYPSLNFYLLLPSSCPTTGPPQTATYAEKSNLPLVQTEYYKQNYAYHQGGGKWRYSPAEPILRDALGNVNYIVEVLPDCQDSPVSVSRSIVFGQEVPELPSNSPEALPPHLAKTVLNSTIPEKIDPLLMPLPQHITINHLYVWPRRSVLMLGMSMRYKGKTVTTVLYKPMHEEMIKNLQKDLASK